MTGLAAFGSNFLLYSGLTRVPPDTAERGNVWFSPGGNGLDLALFPPPSGGNTRFEWSDRVFVASARPGNAVDVIGEGGPQSLVLPPTVPEPSWVVTDLAGNQTAEIFGKEPTPGIAGGSVFQLHDVATNASGTSALAVEMLNADLSSQHALYVGPSGQGISLQQVLPGVAQGFFLTSGPPRLRAGDIAPGAGGLGFGSFDAVKIAKTGRIAFVGRVFDPSEQGSSSEPQGVWLEGEAGLELLALQRRPLRIGRELTAFVAFVDDNALDFDPQGRLIAVVQLDDAPGTRLLIAARAFTPARPVVRVDEHARRTVGRASINLRGRVVADLPVERVEFRSRVQRKFRPAAGQEEWKARVRLRIGRNPIRIRATDIDGTRSAIRRGVITHLEC